MYRHVDFGNSVNIENKGILFHIYQQDINDEKCLSHLKSESKEPLKDSEFDALKTCNKSFEEDPKWSNPEPNDRKEENEVGEGKIVFEYVINIIH